MNKKEGILSPLSKTEDHTHEALRPQTLEFFIGQEQLKKNLNVFIQASKKRQKVMDHVLFYGPPGLGKTTLAKIVANELGVGFRSTSGPILSKGGDLVAILTNLKTNDVLFIDEIHRLSINIEEILYQAMEDYCVDIIIGEGASARSIKITINPFTLIGATTRFGLISAPLRTRFGIPFNLNFYKDEELANIIAFNSAKEGFNIERNAALQIAARSRFTPRIAIRLLKRVHDFALMKNHNIVDQKLADFALNQLEVDAMGLDSNDYRYLRFIADNYDGGPVGIETISAALAEQRDAIEETIEPYLLQIGFVQRGPRGRVLTLQARSYLSNQLSFM
jgi:Holliday junction DNA helicase RuvB